MCSDIALSHSGFLASVRTRVMSNLAVREKQERVMRESGSERGRERARESGSERGRDRRRVEQAMPERAR